MRSLHSHHYKNNHQHCTTMTEKPSFYKLSAAELPDELFRKEATVNDWIGCDDEIHDVKKRPWFETTFDPQGFPDKSLRRVASIDKLLELERIIGGPMYLIANVSPIVVPLAIVLWFVLGISWAKHTAVIITIYHGTLFLIWRVFFVSMFLRRYNRGSDDIDPNDHFYSQYLFPDRNITKYCSMTFVWPSSLQRPALTHGPNDDKPVIFAVIPHGMVPFGLCGYPYFSKVWNSKLCTWAAAPIVLKLPIVGNYFNAVGYIPAKSKRIFDTLTNKNRNVGIVLDGIDGMFHSTANQETGAIMNRKGICKIALKAGVAIVPIYAFGHTEIYDLFVDPFGVLKFLSAKLQVSLTPFFGRWGWFLGPPKRNVPISMCLGDPIYPPHNCKSNENITQELIDSHHKKLLDGFTKVFETHKKGYYGEKIAAHKKLVFVK